MLPEPKYYKPWTIDLPHAHSLECPSPLKAVDSCNTNLPFELQSPLYLRRAKYHTPVAM